ncbi:MAG: sulfatase [Paracoccaceae bacterium]
MTNERPNILWYCTDQQRYDTIGALNNAFVSTPTIDGLVASGTAFTHAYCQSPICTPSRAAFLTGCYPNTVRTPRNGNGAFADARPLVTRLLRDAGYECGLVGKLHLASAFGRVEPRVDDGYSYFRYSHAPRDDWAEGHDYADWVHQKGGCLKELTRSVEGVPAPFHQTTWASDRAIEFITDRKDSRQPWLLSVNVYDPHPPFNPPQAYREMFDPAQMPDPLFRNSDIAQQRKLAALDFQSRVAHPDRLDIGDPILPSTPSNESYRSEGESPGARDAWTLKAAYYAMIKLVDDQLARIIAAIDETGQLDNTLVVFMSDHGETLGDHGLIEKGCRFYEGLVRVPLILSWPGRFRAGAVRDELVELIDVAPTLLHAAGLEVPAHMQGQSLHPLLTGAPEAPARRPYVRSEYFDALAGGNASRATMYRDKRHKLVVYHGQGLGELYDLERDPGEFDNLWDAPEAAEVKMRLLVESFDAAMQAVDLGPERVGPI